VVLTRSTVESEGSAYTSSMATVTHGAEAWTTNIDVFEMQCSWESMKISSMDHVKMNREKVCESVVEKCASQIW